jgi:hypothetical protein
MKWHNGTGIVGIFPKVKYPSSGFFFKVLCYQHLTLLLIHHLVMNLVSKKSLISSFPSPLTDCNSFPSELSTSISYPNMHCTQMLIQQGQCCFGVSKLYISSKWSCVSSGSGSKGTQPSRTAMRPTFVSTCAIQSMGFRI